jgi:hypothetical protein
LGKAQIKLALGSAAQNFEPLAEGQTSCASDCMNNLAFTWKEQGQQAEALRLMEECVCLRSQTFGVNYYLPLSSSKALSEWKMEELDFGIFASENTERQRG